MILAHESSVISPHARIYAHRLVIGKHCRIDDGVIITGDVELGDYIHISAYCVLTGKHGIRIGSYTGVSSHVSIFTASDDFSGNSMIGPTVPEKYKPGLKTGPIVIGRNVIIGSHSFVGPDLTIHDGVAVGCHSYVKKDCDPDTIYAGVPVRKIKDRNKHIWTLTQQLEES